MASGPQKVKEILQATKKKGNGSVELGIAAFVKRSESRLQ